MDDLSHRVEPIKIPERLLLVLDHDLRSVVRAIVAKDVAKSVVPHSLRDREELNAINQRFANMNALAEVLDELTLSPGGKVPTQLEELIGVGAEQLHQCMSLHEPEDVKDASKPQGFAASVSRRVSEILGKGGNGADPYVAFKTTLDTIDEELGRIRAVCEGPEPERKPFGTHQQFAREYVLPRLDDLCLQLHTDVGVLEHFSETKDEAFARVTRNEAVAADKGVVDLSKYFDQGGRGIGGKKDGNKDND